MTTAAKPQTFNQFLREIGAEVNIENLDKLGQLLGKSGSKTSQIPVDRIDEAKKLFAVNGSRPAAASSSTPSPSAKELLARARTSAGAGEEPEDGDKDAATPVFTTSAGELVREFKDKGLKGLSLTLVDQLAPEVKGRSAQLRSKHGFLLEQEANLRATLDVLVAIAAQVKKDQDALAGWDMPNADALTGEIYRYVGACGHLAETRRDRFEERMRDSSGRATPLNRFCSTCMATRIALLAMVPGSATADSRCTTCDEPMFQTGEHGYIMSRSYIWENLVSEVYPTTRLPRRLASEHPDSHPKHVERSEIMQGFQGWRGRLEKEVGLLCAQNPDKANELRAGMRADIGDRAASLGLEIDEQDQGGSNA